MGIDKIPLCGKELAVQYEHERITSENKKQTNEKTREDKERKKQLPLQKESQKKVVHNRLKNEWTFQCSYSMLFIVHLLDNFVT